MYNSILDILIVVNITFLFKFHFEIVFKLKYDILREPGIGLAS